MLTCANARLRTTCGVKARGCNGAMESAGSVVSQDGEWIVRQREKKIDGYGKMQRTVLTRFWWAEGRWTLERSGRACRSRCSSVRPLALQRLRKARARVHGGRS